METTVNQRVKRARKVLKFTQQRVEDDMGISKGFLSRIENGHNGVPIPLLAYYTQQGINPYWLLIERGEPLETSKVDYSETNRGNLERDSNDETLADRLNKVERFIELVKREFGDDNLAI